MVQTLKFIKDKRSLRPFSLILRAVDYVMVDPQAFEKFENVIFFSRYSKILQMATDKGLEPHQTLSENNSNKYGH